MIKIFVGRYITGLPDANIACDQVDCTIGDDDFIFWQGRFGFTKRELGRIPRDSVLQIVVDDKSVIQKRLTTVTRLALFGPFALAMPKRKKKEEYCLDIEWEDANGARRHSVFEFNEIMCGLSANHAANELIKYQQPKRSQLAPDQKKCPLCAETIKKEAKLCRYCRSPLE